MKTTMIAALSAMTMLAMVLAPLGAANPSGSPDATIAGPATVDARDVLTLGVGICQDNGVVGGLPLACDGSGVVPPAGAYVHDTSACAGTVGCNYEIYANQASGVPVTGWGASPCTDRDDSLDTCTNVGSNFDDFGGDAGTGFLVSGDGTKDKDGYAHGEFCARKDTVAAGADYDNLFVFITVWADENVVFTDGSNENLGAGAALGTFNIWVDESGDVSSQAACFSDVAKGIIHTGDDDPDLPA